MGRDSCASPLERRSSNVRAIEEAAPHPGVLSRLARALGRAPGLSRLLDLLSSCRVVVQGESMLPTLTPSQYLLVSRLAYRVGSPRRGDVVALWDPGQPGVIALKRIVGLPGEWVRASDGRVWVDGHPLEEQWAESPPVERGPSVEWPLGAHEYFVLGDHRGKSRDSRAFGPVPGRLLMGRVWACYWPPSAWGVLRR